MNNAFYNSYGGFNMTGLIELSGIRKVYRTRGGEVKALDGIDLSIPKGAFLSITGQSGSGKSTLMNILGCLDRPTEGEYFLDGFPVSSMKESRLSYIRNSIIGFIFQGFDLIPSLSAVENVELPLIYRGLGRSARRRIALTALETVGLEQRIYHRPSELSGGQQQRVAIARALAASPKLILADEPTGNLDSRCGNEIMDILKSLNSLGATVIVITHDRGVAAMAQCCIKISDGRIIN